MRDWYDGAASVVVEELGGSREQGLTQTQALAAQEKYGQNIFATRKKTSLLTRIINQLRDVSIIVLLIAVALSFILAVKEGSGFVEPIIILAIVILNIVLAITQEGKAERALEALADMNAPTCFVLRDGVKQKVDAAELVPGDIIFLETGNIVPADARLLETTGLFSDESALTGESEPSEKDASVDLAGAVLLGDQENMVFSGCIITAGHGVAIVTATGMGTQMGQIADHLQNDEFTKTPLQIRLDKLGKMICWIAIAAAIFLLAVGLRGGSDFGHMLMVAIALAVAAVPETLSLIVTLTLTNGVQKMVKKNALIRKLPAVETLGSTSVICSDKTGTLTQNRMTIKSLWLAGEEPFKESAEFSKEQLRFLMLLAMASNATVEKSDDGVVKYIGNATEVAIMRLLEQKGADKAKAEQRFPKVAEIPFSSERKRMTVVLHNEGDDGYLVLTKGALDRLPLGTMSEEMAGEVSRVHDSFAGRALRVIAIASRKIDALPDSGSLEELESDMTLLGMVGMIDPPRPEVADAIQKAKKAGVRTVMITGDHATTAEAIARDLGILEEGQNVMTGTRLGDMTDRELHDTVRNYSVYARVSPEDKLRIIKAWQTNDEVVAMTGDGVNDAPALKAADVGVAMGKAGTEVAKNASDIVLTDDNFATIVDAIEQGRNVHDNIKKTIYFLLVCNFSEIIIMLFGQMAGWAIILTPIMLLLINLLGDGIPGLQIAREVSDTDLMLKKPDKRNESFFGASMLRVVLRQTVACSVVALVAFYFGAFVQVSDTVAPSAAVGETMAFLTVGWTSIIHILHVRSKKSIFKSSLRNSKSLVFSAAIMVFVFGLLVAFPIGSFFGLSMLGGAQWLIVAVATVFPTIVRELGRLVDEHRPKLIEQRIKKLEALKLRYEREQ